jgi:WD40 repeat protein
MRTHLFSSSRALCALIGVLVLSPVARSEPKDEWTASAVLKDQKSSGWFLAFSPDGKTLAATSGGFDPQLRRRLPNSVRLWDVEKRKLIRTLVPDGPIIQGLAFTSNGKQLVTACYDGTFRRLDVASGREVSRIKVGERMNTANFSPDRKLVLLVNPKAIQGQLRIQHEYQLREVDTGKIVTPAKPFPKDPVMAVGPDGQSLVLSVMQAPDPAPKIPPGVIASPIGGPMLGFLWDAKTGQKSEALAKGNITAAQFSPNGKLILMTTLDLVNPSGVQFWNVAQKKLSAETLPFTQVYSRFAFTEDSSLLAAGGNRAVLIFETAKMTEIANLKDITSGVDALLFGPGGNLLAAACADGTIHLWTRKAP